jgi:hypothetical protein
MCIVTDYIEKYPLRTKQVLGISYKQWRSLTAKAIFKHKELEKLKENQKIRINRHSAPSTVTIGFYRFLEGDKAISYT